MTWSLKNIIFHKISILMFVYFYAEECPVFIPDATKLEAAVISIGRRKSRGAKEDKKKK